MDIQRVALMLAFVVQVHSQCTTSNGCGSQCQTQECMAAKLSAIEEQLHTISIEKYSLMTVVEELKVNVMNLTDENTVLKAELADIKKTTESCCQSQPNGVTMQKYVFSCPPRKYNYRTSPFCNVTISPANINTSVKIITSKETTTLQLDRGDIYSQDVTEFATSNGTQTNAIFIEADASVYVMLSVVETNVPYLPNLIDTTQILPIPQHTEDEYRYFLASQKLNGCNNNDNTHFYTIAAFYSGTSLKIYEGAVLVKNVILNTMQTHSFVSMGRNRNYDPTGHLVLTNKPVSVISGTLCGNNFHGWTSYMTSIQPEGDTLYLVPNLGNSKNLGYTMNTIGHANRPTTVDVTSSGAEYQKVIGQGEKYYLYFSQSRNLSIVECSELCTVYLSTVSTDEKEVGSALFSIIPYNRYYTSVYFVTLNRTFPHFLSIIAEGENPYPDVTLDGESLDSKPWAHENGYSTVWFEIERGAHWLSSNAERKLWAYVYGHSGNTGAGYGHSLWAV